MIAKFFTKHHPPLKKLENYDWAEIREDKDLLEDFAQKYFPRPMEHHIAGESFQRDDFDQEVFFNGKTISWMDVLQELFAHQEAEDYWDYPLEDDWYEDDYQEELKYDICMNQIADDRDKHLNKVEAALISRDHRRRFHGKKKSFRGRYGRRRWGGLSFG